MKNYLFNVLTSINTFILSSETNRDIIRTNSHIKIVYADPKIKKTHLYNCKTNKYIFCFTQNLKQKHVYAFFERHKQFQYYLTVL